MKDLRLISFLPSATEMVCVLGLEKQLIGVTHECDFPPLVRSKPVVVRSALALQKMSMREIDVAVSKCIGSGGSLYEVDAANGINGGDPRAQRERGVGGLCRIDS